MASITLIINGAGRSVDVEPTMPLLWVLRDALGMTGTKFGCGIGQCGACTVLLDGQAVRACQTPASAVGAKRVTTIEGLGSATLHPVQQAWVDEDVPQCGYCQPGMIMTTVALLTQKPRPTDADIDRTLGRHICRCGTYARIRKAVHRAAAATVTSDGKPAQGTQAKAGA